MNTVKDKARIWEQHKIEFPDPPPNYCEHARRFKESADALVADAVRDPTEITLNQSMLLLTKTYWDFYESVPKVCKNHIGTRNGHICLFQVYRETWEKLRALELTNVSRPRVFEPSPPPTPPQIAGVFIGEELEEDE